MNIHLLFYLGLLLAIAMFPIASVEGAVRKRPKKPRMRMVSCWAGFSSLVLIIRLNSLDLDFHSSSYHIFQISPTLSPTKSPTTSPTLAPRPTIPPVPPEPPSGGLPMAPEPCSTDLDCPTMAPYCTTNVCSECSGTDHGSECGTTATGSPRYCVARSVGYTCENCVDNDSCPADQTCGIPTCISGMAVYCSANHDAEYCS
jgi:hypothetical protein